MTPYTPKHRRRRAFFLTDSIVGFMLVGVLGLVLVVAVTTATKAQHRLDDASAAAIAAEQTMALLRDGQPAPPSLRQARIQIKPAEGGAPVAGHRWVEVTATRNGRTASLTGLVPEGARR